MELRTPKRIALLLVLVVALVGSGAPAMAQDNPTDDAYSTPEQSAPEQSAPEQSGHPAPSQTPSEQTPTDDAYPAPEAKPSLPMSGLDLALIAAGGTLMLAAGFGMRHALRDR